MSEKVKRPTGGSAFPFEEIQRRSDGLVSGWTNHKGMTMRDLFAAKAMAAILSGPQLKEMKSIAAHSDGSMEGVIAHFSYKMADAMIKERVDG